MTKLNKTQKIWLGVSGFAILIGGAIGIKKYRNKKTNSDFDNNIIPPVSNFPLKYGSRGLFVKRIQKWLNQRVLIPNKDLQKKLDISKLKEDGIFGKNTLNLVRLTFKSDIVSGTIFKKIRA